MLKSSSPILISIVNRPRPARSLVFAIKNFQLYPRFTRARRITVYGGKSTLHGCRDHRNRLCAVNGPCALLSGI
ncbi:hypothetical protein E4T56_gene16551 [Termitomyces sp. T112]|nr:hypothetical protein E4T56_gene16551 [Termitomyces sp. T112]